MVNDPAVQTEPRTEDGEIDVINGIVKEILRDNDRQRQMRNTAKVINDFIHGNQWQEYDIKTKVAQDIVSPVDPEEQRRRAGDNLMYPLWRTYKAHIQRMMPKVKVSPESEEDIGDIWGVEFGEKIVDYIHRTQWKHSDGKIANILMSYGTAFPYMTVTDKKRLRTLILPSNQIFPYPQDVIEWKDVIGFAYERMVPKPLMEALYPDNEFSVSEIPDHLQPTDKTREPAKTNLVHVVDYWQRPNGKDKGSFVVFANHKIVKYPDYKKWLKKFPYDHGQLPTFPIKENDLSEGIFGFPTLELILNQQVDHNKAMSILAELWDTIPYLLVPYESRIKPKEAINRRRRVMEYFKDGGKPEWSNLPQINMSLAKALNDGPRQMEHTACMHEVLLRGETVGSLQSGVALQTLQEQDLTKQFPLSKSLKGGLETMYTQGYELIRQWAEKEHILEILGDKGVLHYAAYKAIKLSPMTFEVDAESIHPRNKAVDVENAIRAAQYGAINFQDPKERMAFLDLVAPNIVEKINPTSLDEKMARFENKQMLNGIKMVPNEHDDHPTHIRIIDEIMKDPRFALLKKQGKKGQELWVIFEAHRDVHNKEYERQMNEMMLAQAQAQAAGQQGPGGGNAQS